MTSSEAPHQKRTPSEAYFTRSTVHQKLIEVELQKVVQRI